VRQPTRKLDRDTPPGWDTNPSSFRQRLPIVLLALVALAASLNLAFYQLDIVARPFEPFFGDGSRKILESWVSELFPVPDAALGAASYLIDAASGAIGGRRRWQTMPWMVILFGLFVGPLGAVSVFLVILQPVLFQAWCTLCLLTALLAVLMIGPAMDEVLASLQFLKRVRARGESVWKAFWGTPPRGLESLRTSPAGH
jgi:uncharacterized membrane protein